MGTARVAGLGWREDVAPPEPSSATQDAVQQIQAALDLGVTLFDTADNYGRALSERILGKALRGRRDGIVVVTKSGQDLRPDQDDLPTGFDMEMLCDVGAFSETLFRRIYDGLNPNGRPYTPIVRRDRMD